jgi:RNA polymerase sigma-70 factor (ECF subfamily)
MSASDRELVERARQGDGAAIAELFSRYWRAARAAAFGVTGELASAEDAAAEGFRQAWAGLDSLRDPERFGPWLRTIVVRKARLASRERRAAPDGTLGELPAAGDPPDDVLERLQLAALVQQLVRQLPARLREAVSLFYFEGYDTDSAARFLEIPPGTFRRRLHEGRSQLRSAADHLLERTRSMRGEREREIQRLRELFDRASTGEPEAVYQAFRATLALRPAPKELVSDFMRRRLEFVRQPGEHAEFAAHVREMARHLSGQSDRASNPRHPVSAVAARIRRALPPFQEWTLDVAAAAAHLLSFSGDDRDRLHAILPPGFAEGRPGAFLRPSRGLLLAGEDGSVRTTYQLLRDSTDSAAFRAGLATARISDVLDFSWMAAEPIELRSVQELLEQLTATVLTGAGMRFVHYDEPRYRVGLRLHIGDVISPAAVGGVLAGWQGRPPGVDAAHVRFFLEPWATVESGHVIDFDRVPPPFRPAL